MKLVLKIFAVVLALALIFALEFAWFGDYFDLVFSREHCALWFAGMKPYAWLVGIALLVGDLLLPVPASGVMAALGSVYGVWMGTAISAFGSMSGAYIGYALARYAGKWIVGSWFVSDEEISRFKELFDRGGGWVIIISRALPILPEVVAILAGLATMKSTSFLCALVLVQCKT